jgi:pimeloyl-ACP methyl ester carboxylesterase
VVQAAHDRLVHPRHSEVLASRLPHARLVRVGTAGHGLVVESADAVNDALRAHVRDHHPS